MSVRKDIFYFMITSLKLILNADSRNLSVLVCFVKVFRIIRIIRSLVNIWLIELEFIEWFAFPTKVLNADRRLFNDSNPDISSFIEIGNNYVSGLNSFKLFAVFSTLSCRKKTILL